MEKEYPESEWKRKKPTREQMQKLVELIREAWTPEKEDDLH